MSSSAVPYAAIRIFAEVVKLGSLAAAAQTTGVTPSAVSHRIASLEDWIGAPILDRSVRRPRPTALGQALLDGSARAFDRLDRVATAVQRASLPDRVVISAPPAICALRLFACIQTFGDGVAIELRPIAFNAPIEDDPVDLAIRFMHVGPSDLRLGAPGWSAVCSKSQWEAVGQPRHIKDLRGVPLIHEAVYNFWPGLLDLTASSQPQQYVPFGDALSVFSAVSSGYGAALLPREVTRLAVASGDLVTLDGGNAEPDAAFYVVETEIGRARDVASAVQKSLLATF